MYAIKIDKKESVMAIKDLALFKLIGSVVKKGKDKIVGITKKSEVEKSEESVQETFKAMVGKNEKSIASERDAVEKTEVKAEEKVTKEETPKTVDTKTISTKDKEPTTQKSTLKKVVKKTTITKDKKQTVKKSAPVKKETKVVAKKSTPKAPAKKAAAGTKREAKIKLYTKDVQKHYGSVDESFLTIIVKNLGPSIYRKDAEFVSCSDPKELETVRKNFLIKKLGFDKSENDMLDGEIKKVCETMKSAKLKFRATFHYILAKNLKKESALS